MADAAGIRAGPDWALGRALTRASRPLGRPRPGARPGEKGSLGRSNATTGTCHGGDHRRDARQQQLRKGGKGAGGCPNGGGAHPRGRGGLDGGGMDGVDACVLAGTVGVEETDEEKRGVVGDSIDPVAIPRTRTKREERRVCCPAPIYSGRPLVAAMTLGGRRP